MRGLHVLVMAQKVLYLGASDIPAWVVVKANSCMFTCPMGVFQGWLIIYLSRSCEWFDTFLGLSRKMERGIS
jgi:hypothetical protein